MKVVKPMNNERQSVNVTYLS